MKNLYHMLARETRLFLAKKNLAVWLIVIILMIININSRIIEFARIPAQEKDFKQTQGNYFERANNYELYGRDGIKFLYVPSPAWVLSANGVIPAGMMGRVDSLVTVQLYDNKKDRSLSPGAWSGRWDYGVINSLFITLMALWYAAVGFKSPQYMLFRLNLHSPAKEYFLTHGIRFLLFVAAFLVSQGVVYLFILLRGIRFLPMDAAGFITVVLAGVVMVFVFFSIGLIIGKWGRRSGAFIAMFAVWAVLNLGAPRFVGQVTEPAFPEFNRDFKVDLDKYNTLMNFEDRAKNEHGEFNRNNIEEARKVAEEYLKKVFPEIDGKESELKEEMKRAIDRYNRWCIWFPTTFYRQVLNEAGSVGYMNYQAFYDYVQGQQGGFVRFYVERVFYHDPKELVNYIKGDEDIFRGRSYTPPYFGWGLLLQFLLGLVLFIISYFVYKTAVFPKAQNPEAFDDIKIDMESNKKIVLKTDSRNFFPYFRQLAFGQAGKLPWKVNLDGKPFLLDYPHDCLYVPSPCAIPGELRVKDVLDMVKGLISLESREVDEVVVNMSKDAGIFRKQWQELDKVEQFKIMLLLLKYSNHKMIILEDFAMEITHPRFHELTDLLDTMEWKKQTIIDLVYLSAPWLNNLDIKYWVSYNRTGKKFSALQTVPAPAPVEQAMGQGSGGR